MNDFGDQMREDKRIFALGFFDGVHLGHQALLGECIRLVAEQEYQAGVVTFDGHPDTLVLGTTPGLINTPADRERLLTEWGIDTVISLPFDKKMMTMPWQDFIAQLLEYGAAGFVCGNDFRFGHRGEGTAEKLKNLCAQRGMPCVIVPEQTVDGVRVSSTYIRSLLENGEMETAVKFLGHPHILTGTVVPGRQLGRTIGIPTANLELPEGLLVPKFGVYACFARIGDKKYPAVTNIGTRPTVGGHHVTVEPWILDFEGDLYGQALTLEFYKFLRPERKFDTLEQLRQEIQKNAEETKALLSGR